MYSCDLKKIANATWTWTWDSSAILVRVEVPLDKNMEGGVKCSDTRFFAWGPSQLSYHKDKDVRSHVPKEKVRFGTPGVLNDSKFLASSPR